MVKKLFKYEILSYLRVFLPVNLILLAIAVMGRIVQIFENDTIAYDIIFGSSIFALVVGILAAIFMVFIVSITRFYKNLFTSEGYLTLTLPVTPAQHILVKLATSILFGLATLISVLLSLAVITSGEVLVEVWKAADYLLEIVFDLMGSRLVFYILEAILLILTMVASEYLLYYACIALGQRAKKNRVLMAVFVYFIYYMITQVLATVLMILLAILASSGALETLFVWVETHMSTAVHIALIGGTVFSAGTAVLFFWLTHSSIKKHLNLE